jgi:hypothetical protein
MKSKIQIVRDCMNGLHRDAGVLPLANFDTKLEYAQHLIEENFVTGTARSISNMVIQVEQEQAAKYDFSGLSGAAKGTDVQPEETYGAVERLRAHVLYDEDADTYTANPRNAPSFRVGGAVVREMKRSYAHKPHGLGWTINQVCRHFRIGRPEFQFLKTQLGWSHDQDEYTREEHMALDTAALLDDREQRSRWELEQAAKDKARAQDAADAAAYRRYVEPLEKAVALYQPGALNMACEDHTDMVAVMAMPDIHITECEDDMRAKLDGVMGMLARAQEMGVRKLFLAFQGDWFNADTYAGTTTRGTQVTHTDTMRQMVQNAVYMAVEVLRGAMHLFDEVGYGILAGNHDRVLSYAMEAHFDALVPRNKVGTLISIVPGESFALRIGRGLSYFDHGDGGRGKPDILINQARQACWGFLSEIEYEYLTTGHLHHELVRDVMGVRCKQLPAPKGWRKLPHAWEAKMGYHSLHGFDLDIYTGDGRMFATLQERH